MVLHSENVKGASSSHQGMGRSADWKIPLQQTKIRKKKMDMNTGATKENMKRALADNNKTTKFSRKSKTGRNVLKITNMNTKKMSDKINKSKRMNKEEKKEASPSTSPIAKPTRSASTKTRKNQQNMNQHPPPSGSSIHSPTREAPTKKPAGIGSTNTPVIKHRKNPKARDEVEIDEIVPLEDTAREIQSEILKNYNLQNHNSKTKIKPVPIVIISSLRPGYLQAVLDSIQPVHQNPNTPDWILHSKRYVFCHKNEDTDVKDRWNQTQQVIQYYNNTQMVVFEGHKKGLFPPSKPIRSYLTKIQWYHMMDYLFHNLNETEVLILEDDAVLAHDGLMVAARMLLKKTELNLGITAHVKKYGMDANYTRLHPRIQHVALGGAGGQNTINADPNNILIVRPPYFTAMAYSLSAPVFDHIHRGFQQSQALFANLTQRQLNKAQNDLNFADWTMEITQRPFIPDLIQLRPSVGRMHHIGIHGMGYDGNGKKHEPFPIPWEFCEQVIQNNTRTMEDIELLEGTHDVWGYFCPDTLSAKNRWCSFMKAVKDPYGPNKMSYKPMTPEEIAAKDKEELERALEDLARRKATLAKIEENARNREFPPLPTKTRKRYVIPPLPPGTRTSALPKKEKKATPEKKKRESRAQATDAEKAVKEEEKHNLALEAMHKRTEKLLAEKRLNGATAKKI